LPYGNADRWPIKALPVEAGKPGEIARFGVKCGSACGVPTHPLDSKKGVSALQEILKYLKDRGERLDSEIATDTGISLENVRLHVSALSARGEVMLCQSIRFNNGKRSEGLLCRIAGYIPPAAPGRKSKAHLKALTQTS
jgi:hypothetical protein